MHTPPWAAQGPAGGCAGAQQGATGGRRGKGAQCRWEQLGQPNLGGSSKPPARQVQRAALPSLTAAGPRPQSFPLPAGGRLAAAAAWPGTPQQATQLTCVLEAASSTARCARPAAQCSQRHPAAVAAGGRTCTGRRAAQHPSSRVFQCHTQRWRGLGFRTPVGRGVLAPAIGRLAHVGSVSGETR